MRRTRTDRQNDERKRPKVGTHLVCLRIRRRGPVEMEGSGRKHPSQRRFRCEVALAGQLGKGQGEPGDPGVQLCSALRSDATWSVPRKSPGHARKQLAMTFFGR